MINNIKFINFRNLLGLDIFLIILIGRVVGWLKRLGRILIVVWLFGIVFRGVGISPLDKESGLGWL